MALTLGKLECMRRVFNNSFYSTVQYLKNEQMKTKSFFIKLNTVINNASIV